jgi:uncharacterized membrane protein YphA (DoxX/SURF4 family)
MNLVRPAARLMLASFFVVNGVKAVRKPETMVAGAEPIAKAFVPLAQQTLPPKVASYIPEDTKSLVRLNGVASVLGGLGFATGIFRRGGASLAAASMLPHVIASYPSKNAADRDAARSIFVRNLALFGAALLGSQDLQGQPSLAWRANDQRVRLAREAEKTRNQLTRDAQGIADDLSREAGRTKRQLAKEAKKLRKQAAKKVAKTRKSIEGALS